MGIKTMVFNGIRGKYTAGSVFGTLVESFIRFLQFVLGLAVIGLYAQDVDRERKAGDPIQPKWLYATIIGSTSSLAALLYIVIPCLFSRPLSQVPTLHLPSLIFDTITFILWLTQFGMFAKLYIHTEGEHEKRMRHSVWVDLACLVLWAATALWCGLRWVKGRKAARQGQQGGFSKGDEEAMAEM